MHKRIIYFVLLSLTGQITMAQPMLTKEMAVGITIENNFNIKIAENNLAVSEYLASKDNLGYLPTVNGTAGGTYNIDNIKSNFQDGSETKVSGSASNNLNAGVNVNYVLFDGFNRKYSLERGQETIASSQLDARNTLETLLIQLFNAYYETARIESDFQNLQEILDISKDRLARAEVSLTYGRNTSLDVSNAEVDVNNDSINILNQEQLVINAKHNLNFLLNRPVLTEFLVDTSVVFNNAISKAILWEGLERSNVNLLSAQSNIRLSEIDIQLSTTNKLPTIRLNGDYQFSRNKNALTSSISTLNANGFTGGISLNWAIFDGGSRKVREQTALINNNSQSFNYELIKLQIERDFENAWTYYQNRLSIWRALTVNVQTSRLNFVRSEEKYRLGQITSIEFRQAQSNLIRSLTQSNQAKYEAKISELQLFRISGLIQEAVY